MSTKKSIAIVGATETKGEEIVFQFAQSNYRLLLIAENKMALKHLSETLSDTSTNAEIEILGCVKDGCWEADIIILAVNSYNEKECAQLMQEVATQKIVANISDEVNSFEMLQEYLPYSKIVNVKMNDSKIIEITGKDEEAVEEVKSIFQHVGYSLN